MRDSTLAIIVVAVGIVGTFADKDFDPYVPTALQMLREAYPQVPLVPESPFSSNTTMDELEGDWCRFNMSLEAEPVKEQSEQCKLMGTLLLECTDMALGHLVKDNLGVKHPILPRFGLGPCTDGKTHEGYCAVVISNMSVVDFGNDGKLLKCGDWVTSTECEGMRLGYNATKGHKHDICTEKRQS